MDRSTVDALVRLLDQPTNSENLADSLVGSIKNGALNLSRGETNALVEVVQALPARSLLARLSFDEDVQRVCDESGLRPELVGTAMSTWVASVSLARLEPVRNAEMIYPEACISDSEYNGVDTDDGQVTLDGLENKASLGDSDAQYELGLRYGYGRGGVAQDLRKSMALMHAASSQGHARAMYELGLSYADGDGGRKDNRIARRWLKQAAEAGVAEAAYELGAHYLGAQDFRTALYWLRRAAEGNYAQAVAEIGLLFERGEGVDQSEVQAREYFVQASEMMTAEQSLQYAVVLGDRTLGASRLAATIFLEAAREKGVDENHYSLIRQHLQE